MLSEDFISDPITSCFGVSEAVVGIAIIAIIVVIVNFLVYFWLGSRLLAMISTIMILIAGGILGYIPLWVAALFAVTSFGYVLLSADAGIPEPKGESTEKLEFWDQYGNKLKRAYAAKFGGENSGFNDEVDRRIEVMKNLKRGFTHTIARDWLKRMSRFTEAK